jgi:ribonuclease P protein component
MIPRRLRLPRNRIEYLFRKGKKITNDFFTLRYSPAKEGKPDNFCVIISSATEKSAVKRNRLRRQIYEILRQDENVRTGKDGIRYEIAVIGGKKSPGLDYGQMSDKINDLLNKLSR